MLILIMGGSGAAVLLLAVAVLIAVRRRRKQGSQEAEVVDMVGVQPGGHQAQSSNVSNASMYAEEFKTQGNEHGVDVDYIKKVMNNSEFDENRAPKVLGYNEYVHPPNEKAANRIYGCKTSGKPTENNGGDLEQPSEPQ